MGKVSKKASDPLSPLTLQELRFIPAWNRRGFRRQALRAFLRKNGARTVTALAPKLAAALGLAVVTAQSLMSQFLHGRLPDARAAQVTAITGIPYRGLSPNAFITWMSRPLSLDASAERLLELQRALDSFRIDGTEPISLRQLMERAGELRAALTIDGRKTPER